MKTYMVDDGTSANKALELRYPIADASSPA